MNKWYIYSKKADFKAIASQFGIDQLTARILRNRDIVSEKDIQMLMHGGLTELYDAGLLPDIGKAADIVLHALLEKKKIRVVGDYDIDGVCATYILTDALQQLGARVDYRVPNRILDGYGINMRIVDEAIQDGVQLILTCDNGIAALEELKKAKENGIHVVVTDHHNVRIDEDGNDVLPSADAVVDVKRRESLYPTQDICGAVTAWKLIGELYRKLGRDEKEWLRYIEFAAMATIGDIMQLTGENRIIVREGLKVMNGGRNPYDPDIHGSDNLGLRTLIDQLALYDKSIDTYHIGFVIGPCINAGGRLESADIALQLFMTKDQKEANILAGHLKMLNEQRKSMTEEGVKEGIRIIEEQHRDDKVLVVYLSDLHESLAGIVAGRIKEVYCKPTIVITNANTGLKGSGRSIESYDMFAELCKASEWLTKFGGHKMAAGLSLETEKLENFRRALNGNALLGEEDFVKKIWIDAAMPFGYIRPELIMEIEALAPFGQGFEKPVFAMKNIEVTGLKVLGKQKNALKMRLTDENGTTLDGIMFGDAEQLLEEMRGHTKISILYYPKINEYAGRRSLQLEVKDFLA